MLTTVESQKEDTRVRSFDAANLYGIRIRDIDVDMERVRQNLTQPDGDSGGFSRQIQRHGFCRLPTSLTAFGRE
jgi:hypothetical protein